MHRSNSMYENLKKKSLSLQNAFKRFKYENTSPSGIAFDSQETRQIKMLFKI